jgi:hypothetical protein
MLCGYWTVVQLLHDIIIKIMYIVILIVRKNCHKSTGTNHSSPDKQVVHVMHAAITQSSD